MKVARAELMVVDPLATTSTSEDPDKEVEMVRAFSIGKMAQA
jgi:hypothetical protein